MFHPVALSERPFAFNHKIALEIGGEINRTLTLQDELDHRGSRLIERRYQQSGLDEKLTLAEFDWGFNPKLPNEEVSP